MRRLGYSRRRRGSTNGRPSTWRGGCGGVARPVWGPATSGVLAGSVCQPSPDSFLADLYPNTVHVDRNCNACFPCQRAANERGQQAARQKTCYYGMIELIDEQVGRMLEALSRTGQGDDPVVIFVSDHGEMLSDHGLTAKAAASTRGRCTSRWPSLGRCASGSGWWPTAWWS